MYVKPKSHFQKRPTAYGFETEKLDFSIGSWSAIVFSISNSFFVSRQSRVCQAKLSFSASLSDVYVKAVIEYTVGQPSIIIRPCLLSVGRQLGVEFF